MAQELLTTGDVARALGVTLNTVKAWIRAGRLEALRLPSGHYRIPRTELDRLLDEGQTVQRSRSRELFEQRRRAWDASDAWTRARPDDPVSIEEALAHMDAMFDLARKGGSLGPAPIEDKAAGIARMRRALSCLPR